MKLVYGQAAITIAVLYLGKDILQMYLENTLPPQILWSYCLGYKDTFHWTPAQYFLQEFSQLPTALSSDDFLKVMWLIGLGQVRSI